MVVEDDHLLAVWLEPGPHSFRLRYWPRTLTLALIVSCVGILGSALFLARRRIGAYLPRAGDRRQRGGPGPATTGSES